MNAIDQNIWLDEALGHVFRAIASNENLRKALVFKGARILAIHLGNDRKSLDLDSNLSSIESINISTKEDVPIFLRENIGRALERYFESQNPVRFSANNIKVQPSPAKEHPRGWGGYDVFISLLDGQYQAVRGLPHLSVEVAAEETVGKDAVVELPLDEGIHARCHALHRIAAEKLRAFLQSLPRYCNKLTRPARAQRVKDLYDLARILRARPIDERGFWDAVVSEFKLACETRLVDCNGLDTFKEEWGQTKEQYEKDISLKQISFGEAEDTLVQIITYFSQLGIFPLTFPLPPLSKTE